jgi:hypothetical protein
MKIQPFDFSKPPHQKTIDLLIPVIPGIFFEASVLWGRPELFSNGLLAHLGYYSQIMFALFCAYFVGFTSLVFVSFIYAIPIWGYGKYLNSKSKSKGIDQAVNERIYVTYNVWGEAARALLKKRYGIKPPPSDKTDMWDAWHAILGTPTAEEVRGNSMVRAMYAAGWLGLFALTIASQLRDWHFYLLLLVLMVGGIRQEVRVIRDEFRREYVILMKARSVLREIPLSVQEVQQEDLET